MKIKYQLVYGEFITRQNQKYIRNLACVLCNQFSLSQENKRKKLFGILAYASTLNWLNHCGSNKASDVPFQRINV